jgi:cation:H+ antiporter|tara:strand:- start:1470 stop:2396 length:927 start_codon:yes stop_codon:yes gene_type:complete
VFIGIIFLIIGSAMLFYGAEFIVKGGSRLARYFGLSPIVIGLTVVAFGTSLPELVVSIVAAIGGSSPIAIGNVVGSNIANVGLVLGISSLIFPIKINLSQIKNDLIIYIFVCLMFSAFCMNGSISRQEGLILFLSVLIYTWYSFYYSSSKNNDEDVNDKNPSNLRMLFILIISGITLLSFGANLFVKGAIDIARYFGISEIVIGMTIVALGTSLPELATSVIASFRKEHAISIGNIVGSNLFNLLSVIGIVSLVSPIESPKEILFFEIPYMIIYGLILFPIGMLKQPIHRLTAAFLLIGYLLFIYQLF